MRRQWMVAGEPYDRSILRDGLYVALGFFVVLAASFVAYHP